MNIPFTILFCLFVSVILLVAKAVLVSRGLRDGVYSPRNFVAVAVLFAIASGQSLVAHCGYAGCGWGLRFLWVPQILRSVLGPMPVPDGQVILVAAILYALLCISFFGHVLGWAIYAVSRTRSLIG